MVQPANASKLSLKGKTVPAFSVRPEDLVLVTDKKHPLYDERVHLPVDEAMVASIMYQGVAKAVIVRRNGPHLEVVDGRQRVKNAIEANKRLVEQGRPPVKVIVIPRGGEDREIFAVSVTVNEIHKPDLVLIKAAKAQRLLNLGYTLDEVGVMFGKSGQTVENWLKLCGLHRDVRNLVARGKLKYTVAMRLAALPREEQVPKLREILRAAPTNANAVRAVVGGKLERVRPPSKQQLRRIADGFLSQKEFLATEQQSDVFSFVSWVLGRISTEELLSCLSTSDGGAIGETVRVVMSGKDGKK